MTWSSKGHALHRIPAKRSRGLDHVSKVEDEDLLSNDEVICPDVPYHRPPSLMDTPSCHFNKLSAVLSDTALNFLGIFQFIPRLAPDYAGALVDLSILISWRLCRLLVWAQNPSFQAFRQTTFVPKHSTPVV